MHQPAVGEARKPFTRIVVGEADRLAAEVARRHHQAAGPGSSPGRPEQQRVQRRVGQHDPEVGVVRAPPTPRSARRTAGGSSTIGRCGPRQQRAPTASSTCAIACAAGRSATITANGLSPRRFRRRSSATAASLAASQARWYPPMPLTARMPPSRSSRRAPRVARFLTSASAVCGRGSAASARSAGSTPAGHGTGGRRGRRTRARSRRTSGRRPSWSRRGRRAARR